MDSLDITKMVAKIKVKLLIVIMVILVLMGLFIEYTRYSKPYAEVYVVVLLDNDDKQDEPQVVSKKQVVQDNAGEGFLSYLQEMHERVSQIQKPQSALLKIIPEQKIPEEPVRQEVQNEQIIEVYDESGEVVEIVEVQGEEVVETDKKAEAPKAEDENYTTDNEQSKVVENIVQEDRRSLSEGGNEIISDKHEDVTGGALSNVMAEEQDSVEEVHEEKVVNTVEGGSSESEESISENENIESPQKEEQFSEDIVNNEKNDEEIIDTEQDGPAIDMMKDIIARENVSE